METINVQDWQKIDIRMGKIVLTEKIEGADKLLKLKVDVGEGEPRQIVAGIAQNYKPGELVGKTIPILANLEPKKVRGIESQGMILAIDLGDDCILLHPSRHVPPGVKVV